MIVNATLVEDGEVFHFSSLDGELFLGVNKPGEPEDEEALKELFGNHPTKDGGQMFFIRMHRRWLRQRGATFSDEEP